MSTPHPLGGRVLWAHLHWTGKRVDPRDGPRPALETDRRDQAQPDDTDDASNHPPRRHLAARNPRRNSP